MEDFFDHYEATYATRADLYEALVACEDWEARLLPALQSILELQGARIVEFGAGTGRLTRLLAPLASEIKAFDASPAMLEEARKRLPARPNLELAQADHSHVPVEDGWADLALEGWAFGHVLSWHPEEWERLSDQYLQKMFRVLRPGGTAILLETLGTGSTEPMPPTEGLARLYARWEALGFERQVLRTDYRFDKLDTARALTRGFFQCDFTFECREGHILLPECTGIWSRRKH